MNKNEILMREAKKLDSAFNFDQLSIEEKLSATCRMLYSLGHDSSLSGQVSVRLADDKILTQRLGLGLEEIEDDNLLVINRNMDVLSGTGMANPANRFHFSLYDARNDINCVIHTHPFYSSALSMLGVPLMISHTDSCVLFERVGFLPHWPGVPVSHSEGELFAREIGDNKALLLAHHGLLVAASSIEEAFVLSVQFEKTAKLQLAAMAAGNVVEIDAELAREARGWLTRPNRINATFAYYLRRFSGLTSKPFCNSSKYGFV